MAAALDGRDTGRAGGTSCRPQGDGRFCHGDQPTMADICMVGHVTAAVMQQIDLATWPTVKRIFETAMALPEFARAHPLAQPDTPEAMREEIAGPRVRPPVSALYERVSGLILRAQARLAGATHGTLLKQDFAFSRHPSFANLPPKRGSRECRVHIAAPCRACINCERDTHTSIQVQSGALRHSLRNGFTAYAALSPATNSSCHRR